MNRGKKDLILKDRNLIKRENEQIYKNIHIFLRFLYFIAMLILITKLVPSEIDILQHGFYRYDYNIYLKLYSQPIEYWYSPYSGYYYSPLFYYLFYPIRFISYETYLVIGLFIYFLGVLICCWKLPWSYFITLGFGIAMLFWYTWLQGNVDVILFGSLIMLWCKSKPKTLMGFIFGLLLFKGIVIYVFPLFWWKNQWNKQFLYGVILGVLINYGLFFVNPEIGLNFLEQITMKSHPHGLRRLSAIDYPWFLASIALFIRLFIQEFEAKCSRLGLFEYKAQRIHTKITSIRIEDILGPKTPLSQIKVILQIILDSILHPIPLLRANLNN